MADWRAVFSRAWIVYLAAALLLGVLVDWNKVSGGVLPRTLSRLRPYYGYLLRLSDGQQASRDELIDGRRYFSAVNAVFGARPDADMFLAFSDVHLGRRADARRELARALDKVPEFFWAEYSLALMALADQDRAGFLVHARSALEAPLDRSLAFMLTSKVYQPLFIENGLTPQGLAINTQRAKALLLQLVLALKSGQDISLPDPLPVRIF